MSTRIELIFDTPPIPLQPPVKLKHHRVYRPANCGTCADLNREVVQYLVGLHPELYVHPRDLSVQIGSSMAELAQSANDGCHSCKVIQTCCIKLGEGAFDAESERNITLTFNEGRALNVQLQREGFEDREALHGDKYVSLELFVENGCQSPWPMIGDTIEYFDPFEQTLQVPGGLARVVAVDPASSECIKVLREWIDQCDSDHPYCKTSSGSQEAQMKVTVPYPRLLIHVGSTEDSLYLEERNSATGEYVALSYCWGKSGGLRLLRENVQRMKSNISWSSLVKVHQDAIQICRGLGLQYLWIDALCIVQDDFESQSAEIMNMDTIYANAYLTIAASASSDGGDGCLRPRQPSLVVSATQLDGVQYEVHARRALPHRVFDYQTTINADPRITSESKRQEVRSFPLFTRGWAWQERLLSPRIVHFTKSEMVWECLDGSCCECGAMDRFVGTQALRVRRYALGLSEDIERHEKQKERALALVKRYGLTEWWKNADNTVGRPLGSAITTDGALMHVLRGRPSDNGFASAAGQKLHHELWRGVVSEYSRKNLSYESDVFPALSGLASLWQSRQTELGRYLAGTWEDDLMRGLLWSCIDSNEDSVNKVARPIRYLAPTWSWASVRRAIDWFPPVTKPVYHATIIKSSCTPTSQNLYGEISEGFIEVSGPTIRTTITDAVGGIAKAAVPHDEDGEKATFFCDCVPETHALIGNEILLLRWSTDVVDARTGRGQERCLVLRACSDEPDTFKRIGISGNLPPLWPGIFEEVEPTHIRIV